MLKWFENLVNPYPTEHLNQALPQRFFAFVWHCAQGVRVYLLLILLCTAGAASFEVLLFSQLGNLVDWLSNSSKSNFLQQHQHDLMVLIAVLIGHMLFVSLQSVVKHQILYSSFPMRLRWRFHNRLLQQSLDYFHQDFAGRLSAKVMQTSLAVREFWMILCDMLAYVVIYFVSIAVVMGHVSSYLLWPLAIWLVGFIAAASFFIPRLSRISKAQADARAEMTGRITDAYTNIQTVKLFSHAGRETHYAKDSMQRFMLTVFKQMRLGTGFELSNTVLSAVLFIGVIGTAVWLWTQNLAAVGVIAATTAMILKLNSMAEFLMWQMSMLFENVGTIQDGMYSMGKPIQIQEQPNALALQLKQGCIEFKDVCFAYNDKNVFNRLNLSIAAGEKIGIVGRSGAGKSTLINLLLHFYQVSSGRILIDGQDIATVTQDSLRAQIAMVTQDTSLLHRSVLDNIRYGRPDATDAEITRAIEQAQADQFIPELSDQAGRQGLDAFVGERGVKLSGGQRQRIALARVFLKNAPILILDEATSALDSEVESAIQSSLDALMQHKTVIAIAHRLSTIAQMDRLIVLDQGQIIEQGTHQQLLALNGVYAQLWKRQTGGFILQDE